MIGAPATAAAKMSVWVVRYARVEPAPRVTDDADAGGIGDPHRDDFFHRGADAFDNRDARLARPEDDVGLKHQIALTCEHAVL